MNIEQVYIDNTQNIIYEFFGLDIQMLILAQNEKKLQFF